MNYPKAIKTFYMRLNDEGRTVATMDVLAPGTGEIIGGSQREERLDMLDHSLADKELPGGALWLCEASTYDRRHRSPIQTHPQHPRS